MGCCHSDGPAFICDQCFSLAGLQHAHFVLNIQCFTYNMKKKEVFFWSYMFGILDASWIQIGISFPTSEISTFILLEMLTLPLELYSFTHSKFAPFGVEFPLVPFFIYFGWIQFFHLVLKSIQSARSLIHSIDGTSHGAFCSTTVFYISGISNCLSSVLLFLY